MSILIKGMEMPTACYKCYLLDTATWHCRVTNKKASHSRDCTPHTCPLIELPPHGRLIDADNIGLTNFEIILCQKGNPFKNALEMLLKKIENAPTIIPASEEET